HGAGRARATYCANTPWQRSPSGWASGLCAALRGTKPAAFPSLEQGVPRANRSFAPQTSSPRTLRGPARGAAGVDGALEGLRRSVATLGCSGLGAARASFAPQAPDSDAGERQPRRRQARAPWGAQRATTLL